MDSASRGTGRRTEDGRYGRRRGRGLTALLMAGAMMVALPGLGAPSARADDRTTAPSGTFSSSFEPTDPTPLASRPFTRPVNMTGPKYANGSMLRDVTAATSSAEGSGPANAADADASTVWKVNDSTSSPWLGYQLGQPRKAVQYTLGSPASSGDAGFSVTVPSAWKVQASGDAKTWTTVDTQTGQSFSDPGVTNSYTIADPGSYRYYRLQITGVSGSGPLELAGWDLLDGTNGPAPAAPMIARVAGGPASAATAKTDVGFSGKHSLHYAGSHLGKGAASSTDVLYQNLNISIGAGTELSYEIFPTMYTQDLTYPSTFAAVDLQLDDGSLISSKPNLADQYGFGVSARARGRAKSMNADQWNKVRIDLSSLKGHRVTKILLSYDNPSGTAGTQTSGWLDDVSLKPAAAAIDASSRTNFVDTRRGSNASGSFSRGNNIPATAMPNGFNFFTPMTDASSQSWLYEYAARNNSANRPQLQGIGISHEPSPWMGDRNELAVMPSQASGTPDATLSTRAMAFSHDHETAQPDLYSVRFDNGVKAEVAPSDHAGVYRFTFPEGQKNGSAIIDQVAGDSKLHIGSDGTVTGWVDGGSGLSVGRSRMFISGRFNATPTAVGTATGRTSAQFARFDTSSTRTVELRIATSFISASQARRNMDLEVTGRSFDAVRGAARTAWNKRLAVIDVPKATQVQKVDVYSDLYRLNLYPNSQSENTGSAASPSWKYASPVSAQKGEATDTRTNAKVVAGKIFVNNGFWDTYRTAWPAYSLLYPDVATELVDGFVQQYRDGGWIARWSSPGYADLMTGTSSDVSFAESYLSGAIPNKLALEAYDAAVKNATTLPTSNGVGRKGLDTSQFLGYTSNATGESVSWGLEGYINDFAIGRMAQKLAKDPRTPLSRRSRLAQEGSYFTKRAQDYVNMFDPKTNFFQGRTPAGSFAKSPSQFDPTSWGGDFTESDGWNFAFHAPYDVDGLAALYGGTKGLEKKLDTFFATPETGTYGIHEAKEARDVRLGQLGISNQVSHHIPYLYAAAGDPSKTQKYVRDITSRLFTGSEIGQGYPGDEDNGEMSAWYLFSTLGFYPMALGSGQYTIGSPMFSDATVHLRGGDLRIEAPGNTASTPYIASASFNGRPLASPTIDESMLHRGGVLKFRMSPTPTSWGDRSSDQATRTPYVDVTKTTHGRTSATDGTDVSALVDDNSRSSATFASATPAIVFRSGEGPSAVASYTLTNGADGAAPKSWEFQGSNDGKHWVTMDRRRNEKFSWASQTRPFKVAVPLLFSNYRLKIDATSTGKPATLAEVEFQSDTTVQSPRFKAYSMSLNARAGSPVEGAYATVTGAGSGSGASATIDFLDGKGPQKASVSASETGKLQVRASHTYDKAGVYTARVLVRQGSRQSSVATTVSVARDDSLEGAFDTACLSQAGTAANCDGGGFSFDKDSLAKQGFKQGSTVSVPGTELTFDLPSIASGKPDAASGNGRRIRLNPGAGALQLSVIGTAVNGNQQTKATLTFDDGTTQTIDLSFGDWVSAATDPQFGNTVVATSDGRLSGTGRGDGKASVFSTKPIQLPKGKNLVSLTLPTGDPNIHVFAVATDGRRTPVGKLKADPVQVGAQQPGTSFTARLATITGGYPGARSATVNWGDETPVTSADVKDGTVTGTHSYAAAGTYTATVTVDDGATSAVTTTKVAVKAAGAPTLSLSAGTVTAGQTVTITGHGFKPGERAQVALSERPLDSRAKARAAAPQPVADQNGTFTTTRTVPSSAVDGTYPVSADTASGGHAEARVVVQHRKKAVSLALSTRTAQDRTVTLTARMPREVDGAVEFRDGSTSLGLASVVDGTATLKVPGVAAGAHSYSARFAGDEVHAAASSRAMSVRIARSRTAVGVPAASARSQRYGSSSPATLTAWVSGAQTGTVTFRSGSTVLGTARVVANGEGRSATVTLAGDLPVGSYGRITASLAASGNSAAATSTPAPGAFSVVR